jgi:hypothetical protein
MNQVVDQEPCLGVFKKVQHSQAIEKFGANTTVDSLETLKGIRRGADEKVLQRSLRNDALFENLQAAVAFEHSDKFQFIHPRNCNGSGMNGALNMALQSEDFQGGRVIGDDQFLNEQVYVGNLEGSEGKYGQQGMLSSQATIDKLKDGTVKDKLSWTLTFHNSKNIEDSDPVILASAHVATLTVGSGGLTPKAIKATWGAAKKTGTILHAMTDGCVGPMGDQSAALQEVDNLVTSLCKFAAERDTVYVGLPLLGDDCEFGPAVKGGAWRNVFLVRSRVSLNLKEQLKARVDKLEKDDRYFCFNLLNSKLDGGSLFTPWRKNETDSDREKKRGRDEKLDQKMADAKKLKQGK